MEQNTNNNKGKTVDIANPQNSGTKESGSNVSNTDMGTPQRGGYDENNAVPKTQAKKTPTKAVRRDDDFRPNFDEPTYAKVGVKPPSESFAEKIKKAKELKQLELDSNVVSQDPRHSIYTNYNPDNYVRAQALDPRYEKFRDKMNVFNSLEDREKIADLEQGGLDLMKATASGFFLNAVAGFSDAIGSNDPVGMANMLSENATYSYENRFQRWAKDIQEYVGEKHAIYGDGDNLWSAQYWGNQLQSLGYSTGLIAETFLEQAALAYLTGGMGNAATATTTAAKLAKLSKLGKAGKALNKAGKFVKGVATKERMFGAAQGIKQSYMNALSSGEETYRKYKELGVGEEIAKQKAAEAASLNFKLQAVPLMVLNGFQYSAVTNKFNPWKRGGPNTGFGGVVESFAERAFEGVKNKYAKGAINYGVQTVSEAFEEGIETAMGSYSQYSVLKKDGRNEHPTFLKHLTEGHELRDSMIGGALGGIVFKGMGEIFNKVNGAVVQNKGVEDYNKFLRSVAARNYEDLQKLSEIDPNDTEAIQKHRIEMSKANTFEALQYDFMNGSEQAFESHVENLQEIKKAIADNDTEKLKFLGFDESQDLEFITNNVDKLIDEANNTKEDFENYYQAFEGDADMAFVASQKESFRRDVIELNSNLQEKAQEIRENDKNYQQLSDLGKEYYDLMNRNQALILLSEEGETNGNIAERASILERLNEIKNSEEYQKVKDKEIPLMHGVSSRNSILENEIRQIAAGRDLEKIEKDIAKFQKPEEREQYKTRRLENIIENSTDPDAIESAAKQLEERKGNLSEAERDNIKKRKAEARKKQEELARQMEDPTTGIPLNQTTNQPPASSGSRNTSGVPPTGNPPMQGQGQFSDADFERPGMPKQPPINEMPGEFDRPTREGNEGNEMPTGDEFFPSNEDVPADIREDDFYSDENNTGEVWSLAMEQTAVEAAKNDPNANVNVRKSANELLNGIDDISNEINQSKEIDDKIAKIEDKRKAEIKASFLEDQIPFFEDFSLGIAGNSAEFSYNAELAKSLHKKYLKINKKYDEKIKKILEKEYGKKEDTKEEAATGGGSGKKPRTSLIPKSRNKKGGGRKTKKEFNKKIKEVQNKAKKDKKSKVDEKQELSEEDGKLLTEQMTYEGKELFAQSYTEEVLLETLGINAIIETKTDKNNGITTITIKDENFNIIGSISTSSEIDGYEGISINVNKDYQGKGVSKHLYNLALANVKARGLKGLYSVDKILENSDKIESTRKNFTTKKIGFISNIRDIINKRFVNELKGNPHTTITLITDVDSTFYKGYGGFTYDTKLQTKLNETELNKIDALTIIKKDYQKARSEAKKNKNVKIEKQKDSVGEPAFYPVPTSDGIFKSDYKSEEPNNNSSVFKIFENGNEADVEVYKSNFSRDVNRYSFFSNHVTSLNAFPLDGADKIVTIKKGKAVKENGNWVIKEKPKVVFLKEGQTVEDVLQDDSIKNTLEDIKNEYEDNFERLTQYYDNEIQQIKDQIKQQEEERLSNSEKYIKEQNEIVDNEIEAVKQQIKEIDEQIKKIKEEEKAIKEDIDKKISDLESQNNENQNNDIEPEIEDGDHIKVLDLVQDIIDGKIPETLEGSELSSKLKESYPNLFRKLMDKELKNQKVDAIFESSNRISILEDQKAEYQSKIDELENKKLNIIDPITESVNDPVDLEKKKLKPTQEEKTKKSNNIFEEDLNSVLDQNTEEDYETDMLPASFSDLNDDAKRTELENRLKNNMGKFYEIFKKEMNYSPSFVELMDFLIGLKDKQYVENRFELFKKGWQLNGLPSTDFTKAYETLFVEDPVKSVLDVFDELSNEMLNTSQIINLNEKQEEKAEKRLNPVKTVENRPIPIIPETDISDVEFKAIFVSTPYEWVKDEEGNVVSKKIGNDLNNEEDIKHHKILSKGGLKVGDNLTIKIPSNYLNMKITRYDANGKPNGGETFNEYIKRNNIAEGSPEFYERIPMVAVDKDGDAIFMLRDSAWFNEFNITGDNAQQRIEIGYNNMVSLRNQAANGDVTIEISSKTQGPLQRVLDKNNNPSTKPISQKPKSIFGFVKEGKIVTNTGKEYSLDDRVLFEDKQLAIGALVEIIPENDGSGNYHVRYLRPQKLGKNPDVVSTIINVIDAYVSFAKKGSRKEKNVLENKEIFNELLMEATGEKNVLNSISLVSEYLNNFLDMSTSAADWKGLSGSGIKYQKIIKHAEKIYDAKWKNKPGPIVKFFTQNGGIYFVRKNVAGEIKSYKIVSSVKSSDGDLNSGLMTIKKLQELRVLNYVDFNPSINSIQNNNQYVISTSEEIGSAGELTVNKDKSKSLSNLAQELLHSSYNSYEVNGERVDFVQPSITFKVKESKADETRKRAYEQDKLNKEAEARRLLEESKKSKEVTVFEESETGTVEESSLVEDAEVLEEVNNQAQEEENNTEEGEDVPKGPVDPKTVDKKEEVASNYEVEVVKNEAAKAVIEGNATEKQRDIVGTDVSEVIEELTNDEFTDFVNKLHSSIVANDVIDTPLAIPGLSVSQTNDLIDYLVNKNIAYLASDEVLDRKDINFLLRENIKGFINDLNKKINKIEERISSSEDLENIETLKSRLEDIKNTRDIVSSEGVLTALVKTSSDIVNDYVDVVTNKETKEEKQDQEERDDNGEAQVFDKASVTMDPKSKSSAKLKRFMFNVYDQVKENNLKGFLGVDKFVPFDTVYNTILTTLNYPDGLPSDEATMMQRLKDVSYMLDEQGNTVIANPIVKQIYERIKDSDQATKNMFLYEMGKHTLSMEFVSYSKTKDGYSQKIFQTNSNDILRVIRNHFNSEFRNSDLVENNNGKLSISKTEAQRLLDLATKEDGFMTIMKRKNVKSGTRKSKRILSKVENKREGFTKEGIKVEDLVEFLNSFGIRLSPETINHLINEGGYFEGTDGNKLVEFKDMFRVSSNTSGIFGYLVKELESIVDAEDTTFENEDSPNHPFSNMGSILKGIAKIERKYTTYPSPNSFRDGQKSVYGFTATTNATDSAQRLTDATDSFGLREQLKNSPFNTNSYMLAMLNDEQSGLRDKMQIKHLGITALKQLNADLFGDAGITDLSEIDHTYTKLGAFMDNKQGSISKYRGRDMRMASMFFPNMSDKTQMLMLKTAVFDIKAKDFKDGKMSQDLINIAYEALVEAELNRIVNHFENNKGKTTIKDYDEAAKLFLIFPAINTLEFKGKSFVEHLANGLDDPKQFFRNNFEKNAKKLVNDLIVETGNEYYDSFFENEYVKVENNKLTENKLDKDYLKSRGGNKVKTNLKIAALDFAFNSLLTNANIFQLFSGDPALYSKNGKIKKYMASDGVLADKFKENPLKAYEAISRDIVDTNMDKRLALLIAPGSKLANSKNEFYDQIFLQDWVDITENVVFLVEIYRGTEEMENAKELFKDYKDAKTPEAKEKALNKLQETYPELDKYFEIEGTDAQEYTTAEEHISILFRQGRMDQKTYDTVIQKVRNQVLEEAAGKPISPENILNHAEVKVMMQPIKPVHTGFKYDKKHGVMRTMYVKSSSFPLLPQLTSSKELDKLRKIMEKQAYQIENGKIVGYKGVRASYQTANKVGASNKALNVFNLDGTLRDDIHPDEITNATVNLSRDNFRIQMDVPMKTSKKKEDKVSQGTQTLKLLFGDNVAKMFPDLKKKFDSVHGQYIDLIIEDLYDEMGLPTDGKIKTQEDFKNLLSKLKKFLIKELDNDNPNLKDVLTLIESENGKGADFAIPLWMSAESNKIESLLNSIVDNRINKLKLPGYSYVAASEAGMKMTDYDSYFESETYEVEEEILPEAEEVVENDTRIELFPGVYANEQQAEAIRDMEDFLENSSRGQFYTLSGRGGTGKTTIINKVVSKYKQGLGSKKIVYLAPTHKAKAVLDKSLGGKGEAKTIHSALKLTLDTSDNKYKRKDTNISAVENADIIIIDESSMLDDSLLYELKKQLEKGNSNKKVIFMGDNAQLPPVNQKRDSSVFDENSEFSSRQDSSNLTERMRQDEGSPIVPLSDIVAENVFVDKPAKRAIQNKDRNSVFNEETNEGVLFLNNLDQVINEYLKDYKKDPGSTKIITYNNNQQTSIAESVYNLNKKIREKLYDNDRDENGKIKSFYVGEQLMALSAVQDGLETVVENGAEYTVSKVGPLSVKTIGSENKKLKYEYNTLEIKDNITGETKTIDVPTQESNEAIKKFLGDLAKEARKNRNWAKFYGIKNSIPDFSYAYAVTSHKAQGSTYKNAYVMEDNIMGIENAKEANQSLYVGISRASKKLVMHSKQNKSLEEQKRDGSYKKYDKAENLRNAQENKSEVKVNFENPTLDNIEAIHKASPEFQEYLKKKLQEEIDNIPFQISSKAKEQSQKLDKILSNYLSKLGVSIKDIKQLTTDVDALGAADLINKVIYLAEDRALDTFPEEAAHIIMFMLGQKNPLVVDLMDNIESWDEYQKIYDEYIDIYKGNVERVKFEAAGKLIAQQIVSKFEKDNRTALQKIVDKIIDFAKSIIKKNAKDIPSVLKLPSEVIASRILQEDIGLIPKGDFDKKSIVNVEEALKENPYEASIVKEISNLGGLLTGSTGIADEGKIYRPKENPFHDLDFKVGSKEDLLKIVKHLKEKYNGIYTHTGIKSKDGGAFCFTLTVPREGWEFVDNIEINGKNIPGVKRIQGTWRRGAIDPGVTYFRRKSDGKYFKIHEENSMGIDLFLGSTENIRETQNNKLASPESVFSAKQKMNRTSNVFFGREKDQLDYNNFELFEALEDKRLTIDEYIYYQTPRYKTSTQLKTSKEAAIYYYKEFLAENPDFIENKNQDKNENKNENENVKDNYIINNEDKGKPLTQEDRGDIVLYNGKEYLLRRVNNSGKAQLTSIDGKKIVNFSGTPAFDNENLSKTGKKYPIVTYNNNPFIVIKKDGKDVVVSLTSGNETGYGPQQRNQIINQAKEALKNQTKKDDFNNKRKVIKKKTTLKKEAADKKANNNPTDKIIYTSAWEGEIKPAEFYKDEDGNVIGLKKAQVMVGPKFRDKSGKVIELVFKDGTPNPKYVEVSNGKMMLKDSVSNDLLSITSFRIPTSSHQSMTQLEIVGFLPYESGDMMIVPKNLTTQKGLDFDVDKETTYQLWTDIDKNGNIVPYDKINNLSVIDKRLKNNKSLSDKERKQLRKQKKKILENQIVRMYGEVLSKPDIEMQKKINKVLSMDVANSHAEAIDELKTPSEKMFTLASPSHQRRKMASGSAGKLGIGVYSNMVTFHSMIQQNERGSMTIKIRPEPTEPAKTDSITFGSVISTGVMGQSNTIMNRNLPKSIRRKIKRSITDVLAERQNIATDNVKEQVMNKVNITAETIGADSLLVALGVDLDAWEITPEDFKANPKNTLFDNGKYYRVGNIPFLLLSQPIIVEYVKKMKDMSSQTKGFSEENEMSIIRGLINKYNGNESSTKELSAKNLYNSLTNTDSDIQVLALNQFLSLKEKADTVRTLQTQLNSNKGLGKSRLDAKDKYEGFKNFGGRYLGKSGNTVVLEGFESLFGTIDDVNNLDESIDENDPDVYVIGSNVIKTTNPMAKMVVAAADLSDKLWSQFFFFENDNDIMDEVIGMSKYTSSSDFSKNEFKNKFIKEFKKYLNASYKNNVLPNSVDSAQKQRKDLFFDNEAEGKQSLAKYLMDNVRNIPEFKNNPLISRFSYNISESDGLPSIIKFNNSAGQNVDEKHLHSAIYLLLEQADKLQLPNRNGKEYTVTMLVDDLIKYSLLEGGVQEAIQFSKYIPAKLLIEKGYGDFLRKVNRDGFNSNDINLKSFIDQFFRHNPSEMKKVKAKNVKSVGDNRYTINFDEDSVMKDASPDYVAVYDRKNNKKPLQPYTLYRRISGDMFTYEKVSQLGVFGMSEYSAGFTKVETLINTEKVKSSSKKRFKAKSSSVGNKARERSQFKKGSDKGGYEREAKKLSKVLSDDGEGVSKYLKELLNNKNIDSALRDHIEGLIEIFKISEPKVIVKNPNRGHFELGSYHPGTKEVTIYYGENSDAKTKNLDGVEFYVNLVHELTHAVSSDYLNKNLEADGLTPKANAPKEVLDLKQCYDDAINKENENFVKDLKLFKQYFEDYKKHVNSKSKEPFNVKKAKFLNANKERLYPFFNLKEFITHFATVDEFRDKLDSIDSSLKNRILKIFTKILKALNPKGNYTKNSVAYNMGIITSEIYYNDLKEKSDKAKDLIIDEEFNTATDEEVDDIVTQAQKTFFEDEGFPGEIPNMPPDFWEQGLNSMSDEFFTDKPTSPPIDESSMPDNFSEQQIGVNGYTLNTTELYSDLGNKTESGNVKVVKNIFANKNDKEIITAFRVDKKLGLLESFRKYNAIGNPINWQGFKPRFEADNATIAFMDWFLGKDYTNLEQEYRQEILNNLDNLKGKTIEYYKELNRPSHATALDYLINNYDWNRAEAQQTENFSEKNVFEVIPTKALDYKKARVKASIATQYIGFGEGLIDSSTELYRQQAGKYANTGNYSSNDVIFVSIPGRRGNANVRKKQQDKTIKEAMKAIEKGAVLITDNKSYIDNYNVGEKRLYKNLESKGYNYSETVVDGETLGVWRKEKITNDQFENKKEPDTKIPPVDMESTGETWGINLDSDSLIGKIIVDGNDYITDSEFNRLFNNKNILVVKNPNDTNISREGIYRVKDKYLYITPLIRNKDSKTKDSYINKNPNLSSKINALDFKEGNVYKVKDITDDYLNDNNIDLKCNL